MNKNRIIPEGVFIILMLVFQLFKEMKLLFLCFWFLLRLNVFFKDNLFYYSLCTGLKHTPTSIYDRLCTFLSQFLNQFIIEPHLFDEVLFISDLIFLLTKIYIKTL